MQRFLLPLVGTLGLLTVACDADVSSSTTGSGGTGGSVSSVGGSGGQGGAGGGEGGYGGGPLAELSPPDLGDWTGETPPDLQASPKPPGDLSKVAATHYGDLSCGPHPENLFDILIPDGASGPLPLVLFIHGGGFSGGSRTTSYEGTKAIDATAYLEAGLAYATIDYRFLDALGEGVRTPLQDSQVCLQYLRFHATTLGIDPDKVVATGESAGAGTSLWLGTVDDQADPSHPVLAMSTRLKGVILDATQATYDVIDWAGEVYAPEYEGLLNLGAKTGQFDPALVPFYGVSADAMPSVYEFLETDPEYIAYREAVDMLAWMSADDAPVWASTIGPDVPPIDQDALYHHPFHVRAVLETADAVGLEAQANAPAINETAAETRLEFVQRVLAR